MFLWIDESVSSFQYHFYNTIGYSSIDQCQADYDYEATEKDELSIRIGDVINVTLRHDDGWWKGELNGKTGLFPASYVHQL